MTLKEKVRETVRKTYGNIALQGGNSFKMGTLQSCCGRSESNSRGNLPACGCGQGDIDPDQISTFLGYSEKDLETVPEGANLGLGCGNPQAIASIKPGEVVVDLGSGGGFDCFLAAREVGPDGRVIGVDMTPEMISRARTNKEKAGVTNVEFRLGEIEHLPVEDNAADLIISNCVINLSPEKRQVFQDAFRVLKPGGRLAISDIVTLKPLPEEIKKDLAMVSACVGGAATIDETQKMLKQAGFVNISITPKKFSQDLVDKILPGSHAGEYVVSADIQARKPEDNK